jgi:ABC-type nickel/cobalt efflux system permease component RcnA
MTRLYGHHDRFSLKRAIGHTAVYAFLILFGFLQLNSALESANSYFLFSGPLILTLGIFGVFSGLRQVRAVERRNHR